MHSPEVSQIAADFLHVTAFLRAFKQSASAHLATLSQSLASTKTARVELRTSRGLHPGGDND